MTVVNAFILYSTISSGLNALATVCLHDFVKPLFAYKTGTQMHHKIATNISKAIAAFFGIFVVGLSFLCEHLGATGK